MLSTSIQSFTVRVLNVFSLPGNVLSTNSYNNFEQLAPGAYFSETLFRQLVGAFWVPKVSKSDPKCAQKSSDICVFNQHIVNNGVGAAYVFFLIFSETCEHCFYPIIYYTVATFRVSRTIKTTYFFKKFSPWDPWRRQETPKGPKPRTSWPQWRPRGTPKRREQLKSVSQGLDLSQTNTKNE